MNKQVKKLRPQSWTFVATCAVLSLAVILSGLGLTRAVQAHTPAQPAADDEQKQDQSKQDQQKKDGEEKFIKPPKAPAGQQFQFGNQEEIQKQLQKMVKEVQKQLKQSGLNDVELQKLSRTLADEAKKLAEEIQRSQPQMAPELQKQLPRRGREEIQTQANKQMDDATKNLPQGGFQFGIANGGGRFRNGNALGARPTSSGRLGASFDRPTSVLVEQLDLPKDQGLVIENVQADSAAAKAGLKINDIVLEFDSKPVVSDPQEFRKMVSEAAADKALDAVVLRRGRRETIKGLTLPEAKPEAENPFGRGGAGGFGVPNRAGAANPFRGLRAFFNAFGQGTTMTINNDSFSINSRDEKMNISVAGKLEDGKMKVNSVHIADGSDNVQVDSLERVPEKYKEKVQSLLKNINIGK